MSKKCYCCGINEISSEFFYCIECLKKLKEMFDNNENIIDNPNGTEHCISCGKFDNRKILWTGNSRYFSNHNGDGIPICSICVESELKKYKELRRSQKRYKCVCCGYDTLPKEPKECVGYICPVCLWENDVFMNNMFDLDEKSDCNNGMTLYQARENFKKYNVCNKKFISEVRKAKPEKF